MKVLFTHIVTSPDEQTLVDTHLGEEVVERPEASGEEQDALLGATCPAPLVRVDQATILEADFGNGALFRPQGFRFQTYTRGDTLSEAEVIGALDLTLSLARAEPGTLLGSLDEDNEILFYRGLRHRVAMLTLCGELSENGRVFGTLPGPVSRTGRKTAGFAHECRGIGIPLDVALADLAEYGTDDADSLRQFGEICATAGWLLTLFLVLPSSPRLVRDCWQKLAHWIEADPARSHLARFAEASALEGRDATSGRDGEEPSPDESKYPAADRQEPDDTDPA